MKKIGKISGLLLICLLFTGCFSSVFTRKATNPIEVCKDCVEPENIEELIDNIEFAMNKINAIKGTYELTNTVNTYNIEFDLLTKGKRENWDVYAKSYYNDKAITIYFKDAKFYVIYPNNGANVILKDSLKSLVKETQTTLEKLNATYNKENLENLITGDKMAGFNFEGMKESATYSSNEDGTYAITYNENGLVWEYVIDVNYLIRETRCVGATFHSILKFEYPKTLDITYPMGLDFLTLDIDEVKDILKVDSFAQVLDENLKD